MSTVPADIAGIGSTAQKVRVAPGFDPVAAAIGPEEYFLLSRIDGSQAVRDILLGTGLPIDRAIAIVIRLRSIGALLFGGETPGTVLPTLPRTRSSSTPVSVPNTSSTPTSPATPRTMTPMPTNPTPSFSASRVPIPGRTPTPTATPRTMTPAATPQHARTPTPGYPNSANSANSATSARPPTSPVVGRAPTPASIPRTMTPGLRRGGNASAQPPSAPTEQRELDLRLSNATAEEMVALNEVIDLADLDRRRVLTLMRLVAAGDPWALLGVPTGGDALALKRAYFRLSKDIHPDRFYGKKLGSFATRLPMVFEAVSRAYARLTNPEKPRSGSSSNDSAGRTEQPQTPQEYAVELFERACSVEVSGDALGAMKLFAAAVRIDSQTRYLRRAASCALAAAQPKSALEYAKKAQMQAPDDPSSARLLASAFRAVGKLVDAEEVLVMAMALKSENDSLGSELRHDLAEVRRLMATDAR